jgi:hypothetical protein
MMVKSSESVLVMVEDKKEATIYTHYGTIATSERRDHKAAQGRVGRPSTTCSPSACACDFRLLTHAQMYLRFCAWRVTHYESSCVSMHVLNYQHALSPLACLPPSLALVQARTCHHFFLRHNACVNRHLRFGQEAVVRRV